MADAEMPFVAVVGGLWQLDQGRAEQARDKGRAIGTELARAGFGLVVYFSDDLSLEPHVVSGYVAGLTDRGGEIRVRYAESQRGQVKFKEETDARTAGLFKPHEFAGNDWEAPFYESLCKEEGVHAVLLLAGGTSTFIAGQIALARQLPILPVNEFGGAADKVWHQLAHKSPDTPSSGTHSVAVLVEKLKNDCVAVAARRNEARRREQVFAMITARRQQAGYAAGAFICLLASLFFGIVYIPLPAVYPFVMFAGLIAAGATGALVRILLGGPEDNDPRTSLLLGSVAGFVVGLAYLIPQWIGAPGVLAPEIDTVSATDKIQLASAVLVAVSAGVGFDTVFSRLQKQAQAAAVGPPH